jgi:hypothetical protein
MVERLTGRVYLCSRATYSNKLMESMCTGNQIIMAVSFVEFFCLHTPSTSPRAPFHGMPARNCGRICRWPMERIAPLLSQNLGAKLRLGVRRNGMSGQHITSWSSAMAQHAHNRPSLCCCHSHRKLLPWNCSSPSQSPGPLRVYTYTPTCTYTFASQAATMELDKETSSSAHSPGSIRIHTRTHVHKKKQNRKRNSSCLKHMHIHTHIHAYIFFRNYYRGTRQRGVLFSTFTWVRPRRAFWSADAEAGNTCVCVCTYTCVWTLAGVLGYESLIRIQQMRTLWCSDAEAGTVHMYV